MKTRPGRDGWWPHWKTHPAASASTLTSRGPAPTTSDTTRRTPHDGFPPGESRVPLSFEDLQRLAKPFLCLSPCSHTRGASLHSSPSPSPCQRWKRKALRGLSPCGLPLPSTGLDHSSLLHTPPMGSIFLVSSVFLKISLRGMCLEFRFLNPT